MDMKWDRHEMAWHELAGMNWADMKWPGMKWDKPEEKLHQEKYFNSKDLFWLAMITSFNFSLILRSNASTSKDQIVMMGLSHFMPGHFMSN